MPADRSGDIRIKRLLYPLLQALDLGQHIFGLRFHFKIGQLAVIIVGFAA
jgi:hypothetical protein